MSSRKVFKGGEFLVEDCSLEDVFIPEEMTKEHQLIFKAALDFVKKEIQPIVEEIEQKDEALARRLLRMAGELGLNGTDVPEEFGGEGMDKITTCLVTEAMGGAPSFVVSHAAHTGIGTLPIVYFGNEEQKKKYLPKLANGEWFSAYCLTEPSAGSDALNARTTAVLSDDGKSYILNGEKIYITNGAWADLFIVYAKVDGEAFTGFIVERNFPGITHGAEEKKMGITGSSTTPVVMNNCIVPKENVLYKVGKGHKIAFNVLNIGRYKLGAGCLGGCKVAIAEAARHATSREQFGKKIASFGLVQQKLADMAIRIYILESMVYRMAATMEDHFAQMGPEDKKDPDKNAKSIEEHAIECSISKIFGSEVLDFCVDELVQIFGGQGYIAEYPAERLYRDSRINRIFEGTNEINRLLISGTLVKRAFSNRIPVLDALKKIEDEIAAGTKDENTEGLLGKEFALLKNMKKMTLFTAGVAVNKLLAELEKEQEVLGILADMIMEVYAVEGGLLRAAKFADMKGEKKAQKHIDAASAYILEAIGPMVERAKKILAHVQQGEELKRNIGLVENMAVIDPADTIAMKRRIAERVIRAKRYPF